MIENNFIDPIIEMMHKLYFKNMIGLPYNMGSIDLFKETCKLLMNICSHYSGSSANSSINQDNNQSKPLNFNNIEKISEIINHLIKRNHLLTKSIPDFINNHDRFSDIVNNYVVDNYELEIYECKLLIIQLLMFSPIPIIKDHADEELLQSLLYILIEQMRRTKQDINNYSNMQTYYLSPIISVLSEILKIDKSSRKTIKDWIFCYIDESAVNITEINDIKNSRIDPIKSPTNSLMNKILEYMISIDTNIKRCVSEFIFDVFDENGNLSLFLYY